MKAIAIALLFLPVFLSAQGEMIMPGYADAYASPIRLEPGLFETTIPGWFINDKRYAFYRKLHEFANDADFKGHEKEILDGFGRFLSDSDSILISMSNNTARLEDSSERLRAAQDAVDRLNTEVDELSRQNRELSARLSTPVKQKGRWALPLAVGVAMGIVIGVVL